MRSRFNQQLYVLHNNLIEMGALLEQAITKATKSLLEQDIELATEVKDSDNIIDDKEKEIERLCLKLLLSQQPVARDLRQISAALKMITEIGRAHV